MTPPIYTLDIETDPFKYGRRPKPFAIGFYDGETFTRFWGKRCIQKMREYIETRAPGIIYAHNGGRFDVFYFMDWIVSRPMRVIGSRIVKSHMQCTDGVHEVRDSYAIMPFALGKVKGETVKLEIDISKLEKDVRQLHKEEILTYLERDCILLWRLCTTFREAFGDQLTIGTTAMKQLKKLHKFDVLDNKVDYDIRSRYYYGGRVECFQKGVLPGDWKVYDVNSMYPHVMKSAYHPIGLPTCEGTRITDDTCFISAEGVNYGAFPMRVGYGIRFDVPEGLFHVTRHEWDVAMEHGLFAPTRILRTVDFDERGTFAEFVERFYDLRVAARADGDEVMALFYKYVLNSAYGKFGQNPANYKDVQITGHGEDLSWDGWVPVEIKEVGSRAYIIWHRGSVDASRYHVGCGASITGAARAILLQAIASSDTPIYCDTDSVVCRELSGSRLDPSALGAWKLEAEADTAYIAGKKLYALYSGDTVVKQAHKGVKLTADEIQRICRGETVTSLRDSPSFKLDGSHAFIHRRVRMTA